MTFFRNLGQLIALPLAALLFVNSLYMGVAQANLVTTDQVIRSETAAQDRAKVLSFLSRDDVRQQMQALGVDPAEAATRLHSLSDAEVSRISGKIDTMPAGQDVVGAAIGLLVIVLLVLVILDVLGVTNAFTFIKPIR